MKPTAASRVRLERPSARRRDEFLALERKSRELHRPWVSAPASPKAYANYLRQSRRRSSACFFICREDRTLAAVVNVSEIVGGSFQSAYLGFYAFVPSAGHGYVREGLGRVLDLMFRGVGLHRMEANIQPANQRSITLVQRLGFRLEGFSPCYLKIGGRWRDHERWAILSDEWRRGAAR